MIGGVSRRAHPKEVRVGIRGLRVVLSGILVVATAVAMASPAYAATVNGCAQGWSQYHGTCIWVDTGGKNTSNHTQWVSQITVAAPYNVPPSTLEAWAGNGPTGVAWYHSTYGTYVTWSVNMWIKSNSGICGAYTYRDGSGRSIVCITITA